MHGSLSTIDCKCICNDVYREEGERDVTQTPRPQTVQQVAVLVRDKIIGGEEFTIIVNRESIFEDTVMALERITFSPDKKITVRFAYFMVKDL